MKPQERRFMHPISAARMMPMNVDASKISWRLS
jgi:hypothetical protein